MESAKSRFLRYVTYYTTSDEHTGTSPSTERQKDLGRVLLAGKGYTSKEMKHTFPLIAKEFATIPVTRVPKVKVGVVGEIYVKYSPLGNNDLQKFLESQDCEVNFPGLMGFVDRKSVV